MDRKILTSIFSFSLGIFCSSFILVTPLIAVFIFLIGLTIFLAEKIYTREVGREVLYLALMLISFSLGTLRYAVKDFHELTTPTITGIVINEPEDKDNSRRFVYLSDNSEKVLVTAPLYAQVEYGDRVEVRGRLDKPGIIKGENGERDFDYGKYLSKDDIYYTLSFVQVKVLSSGHGNLVKSLLFRFKRNFIGHAKTILSEPYASLLTGLIVSGRDALPKDILEEFRRAGVIHIVVLSGYNITIIAEFLRRMFQKIFIYARLPAIPQAAAGASIVGIVLFVLMTGAQATVVRAAIMALTVIISQILGRKYSASRALMVAAFLMLIENPKILVFDPSFQLSFLATLGLIYFMDPVKERLSWVTERWQMRDTLSQTLATQLTVLPLLIYMSGDVSLVSIPANLLILTVVPYTMLIGFLATIASYLSTVLAWPLAFASHLLLSWILFVSHTLGTLSFATLAIPNLSVWIIVLVYLLLLVGYILNKWKYLILRKNFQ